MIVLDTNVISEAFRPEAHPSVGAWFGAQPAQSLYLCAPVVAELRYGVLSLAEGRRRDAFAQRYDLIKEEFRHRVLAFTLRAAEAFAQILLARAQSGRPIGLMDAQIAAIARSRGASVATRDLGGFEGCGVPVIDPFS